MLGVGRPRCVAPGCTTQPSFNFPGTPACGAEYCGPHKLHGMVDLANPHCAHGACTLLDLGGSATHCGPHKLYGMVDVNNKHCAHGACTLLDLCPGAWHACLNVHVLLATSDWRQAGHNAGTLTPSAQDVLAEGFLLCSRADDCAKRASFGILGGSATHCGPHKLYGMVDVNNKHCAHGACTLLDLCPGAWHACSNVHVLLATSDWRLAGQDGGTLALSAQDVLAEGFCCALA